MSTVLHVTKPATVVAAATALALVVLGAIAYATPFDGTVHSWFVGALAALAAAALSAFGWRDIRSGEPLRSALGVASLGGALVAADLVAALLAVGAPQRVPVAPGQRYRAPHGSVELDFPPFASPDLALRAATRGAAARVLAAGETTRIGPYVFFVSEGPAASVAASSERGESETVTQPSNAATFVSPFLTFGVGGGRHPQDVFDVNALHRRVRVDYYPGLPSRGIDIPFLLLQVNEQNGGVVFRGAAVSDKTVRAPGIRLRFHLTTYPVVDMTSAPQGLPLAIGSVLALAGVLGGRLIALHRLWKRPPPQTV